MIYFVTHPWVLITRYGFLAVDCHAYLAPYENHTIYFLKDLIMGKKKFISCDRIRYLSLPQYTGLAVKHILEQAQSHEVCAEYLPDADDFSKLPRQWIINITYTLVGQPFADWARNIIEVRNSKLVEEQKLGIDIDPEIMQRFSQSTAVSSKFAEKFAPVCVKL